MKNRIRNFWKTGRAALAAALIFLLLLPAMYAHAVREQEKKGIAVPPSEGILLPSEMFSSVSNMGLYLIDLLRQFSEEIGIRNSASSK